jgi:hypothetical protein
MNGSRRREEAGSGENFRLVTSEATGPETFFELILVTDRRRSS